jgi:hypothetical protein
MRDSTGPDSAGYLSVSGGKWHRAIVAQPTFAHDEQTACGLTVRPLNVTWGGQRPDYAHPSSFCKHCEAMAEGKVSQ